jgi:proteic killer suppression protein
MIKSFNCRETEKIFNGKCSKDFPADIQPRAFRKLSMINASEKVEDLRRPPSNHLEKLSGDRKGQWSIRVNGKYRICFTWQGKEASNVEIVEYH